MLKNGSWAMRVNWTEPALEDLEAIQAYIAKDSSFYARQFIERIFDAATKLESFPEIGRRVQEAEERTDIRELIFQGYRIIYLAQPKHITIIAVIHGSRNLAGTEDKPW
jgi:plasmid stabilization system protein ParE